MSHQGPKKQELGKIGMTKESRIKRIFSRKNKGLEENLELIEAASQAISEASEVRKRDIDKERRKIDAAVVRSRRLAPPDP